MISFPPLILLCTALFAFVRRSKIMVPVKRGLMCEMLKTKQKQKSMTRDARDNLEITYVIFHVNLESLP